MTRDGYDCYLMYLALQRHFSTNYDFFQFNGKVKASKDAYSKRNDIYAFEKLSKIIKADDRIDFFVSHFIENPKEWIRNMSKEKLEKHKATFKNLPIRFKSDMEVIEQYGAPNVMICEKSDIPLIHKLSMEGKISIESLCILDSIHSFFDKHQNEVEVPFAFPEHMKKLQNYKPFVLKKVESNRYNYIETFKDVLI